MPLLKRFLQNPSWKTLWTTKRVRIHWFIVKRSSRWSSHESHLAQPSHATIQHQSNINFFTFSPTVIAQTHRAEVFDEYIIPGNGAILKCSLPSTLKDFVYVSQWIIDQNETISRNSLNFRKYCYSLQYEPSSTSYYEAHTIFIVWSS